MRVSPILLIPATGLLLMLAGAYSSHHFFPRSEKEDDEPDVVQAAQPVKPQPVQSQVQPYAQPPKLDKSPAAAEMPVWESHEMAVANKSFAKAEFPALVPENINDDPECAYLKSHERAVYSANWRAVVYFVNKSMNCPVLGRRDAVNAEKEKANERYILNYLGRCFKGTVGEEEISKMKSYARQVNQSYDCQEKQTFVEDYRSFVAAIPSSAVSVH